MYWKLGILKYWRVLIKIGSKGDNVFIGWYNGWLLYLLVDYLLYLEYVLVKILMLYLRVLS